MRYGSVCSGIEAASASRWWKTMADFDDDPPEQDRHAFVAAQIARLDTAVPTERETEAEIAKRKEREEIDHALFAADFIPQPSGLPVSRALLRMIGHPSTPDPTDEELIAARANYEARVRAYKISRPRMTAGDEPEANDQ